MPLPLFRFTAPAARRLTWTALHAAAQNNSAGVVAALAHAPGADVRAVAWHEGAPKGVLYFACDRPTPEPDLPSGGPATGGGAGKAGRPVATPLGCTDPQSPK